jgi:hypothetical protein
MARPNAPGVAPTYAAPPGVAARDSILSAFDLDDDD